VNPRALVYGDIDLNLLDGSAIWLQSVTQALARAGCAVTLLLKAPISTSRLIAPLLTEPGVTVRSPHREQLLGGATGNVQVTAAADLLARLDGEEPYDLLVLRGRKVTAATARSKAFDGRLWAYLTDVPQSVPELSTTAADELKVIAEAARYLLCQTEELRCFLEGSIPAACGKCVLLPPILADVSLSRTARATSTGTAGIPLRLVYTGKFAPRWNTLEMTGLPSLLAARGVGAELHMVGDKIHDDPADPGYRQRMRTALEGSGVTWHGGQSREDAMRLAASCDIGLSWRHPDLDSNLELSTKVLEFGALGLPVILNRTPAHEALLGADYPLFAASVDEVADRRDRRDGSAGVPARRGTDQRGGRAVHDEPRRAAAAQVPGGRGARAAGRLGTGRPGRGQAEGRRRRS